MESVQVLTVIISCHYCTPSQAERKNKEKFEAGNTEEGDENESDAFIKPASGRNSSRSPDATEAGGTGSSPGTGRGGNQKASGDIDG